jgi:ribosomal protein S18 acetylase RimI-like enzyme
MDIRLVRATDADSDVLIGLARAFHLEDGHALDGHGEAALLQIARGEPFARAWIARADGHPVGYLVITLGYSIEYGGRDGFIDDLYLAPVAREQGFGRRLIEFALARAADLGVRTLHLEVEPGNENATRLYRAAGFEETGRRLMRVHLARQAVTPPPE